MMRLVMVTLGPLDLDPRARRAADAAAARGIDVAEVSLPAAGGARAMPRVSGAAGRELRSVTRLIRLGARTVRLLMAAKGVRGEVVHVHDFDALPAGALLARRHGSRLVYDAHELYTGFDAEPPRLWLAVTRALEYRLARRADAVLTVSDGIADALLGSHRLETRPLVVLNCPPLELPEPAPYNDRPRAIYQASVGPGRYLDDLVPAHGIEIGARVLGASSTPRGVVSLSPVPPREMVSALAGFDVGIVIDRPDTENARLALPNKLFEYLMAGLAVVVPDAPAMAELVRREGVGVVYRPGGLGEALAALAADRPALDEMRRRARMAAVERYNAEAQRPALYEAWGL